MASIFCLEGEWNGSLKSRESVLPLLELLERLKAADFFHRHVATEAEFEFYVKKLLRTSASSYPVVYLATHGDTDLGKRKQNQPGIALGGSKLTLAELGKLFDGRLKDRTLYFGSCLIGTTADDELRQLVKATGAANVVCWESEIDWAESAAFDILLLSRLMEGGRIDAKFRSMTENNTFAQEAGLVFATKTKVYRAATPSGA